MTRRSKAREKREEERRILLEGLAGARLGIARAYAGFNSAADPELIAGRRILLIDDVVTTGSTLSECARTLRTAGAADVVCVTLASARK